MRKLVGVMLGLLVVGLAIGVGVSVAAPWVFKSFVSVQTETKGTNQQVVQALERDQQVSLLGLGIQGILEKNSRSNLMGIEMPGTTRAVFLQYSFTAKLGLEGKDVRVTEQSDGHFKVSVPEFIFIGHDDVTFKMAAEDNGVLSWVTPEIDTLEVVNEVLNDDTQQRYLEQNSDLLKEQTESFYGGLIRSVDPDLEVTFEYPRGK